MNSPEEVQECHVFTREEIGERPWAEALRWLECKWYSGEATNCMSAEFKPLLTLYERVSKIEDDVLRRACRHVLDDPRFQKGYGSPVNSTHKHHAYPGGLVVHTEEVVNIALATAEGLADVDLDILLPAAIWHDYAKIFDYDTEGHKTRYQDTIRHVAGSYGEFLRWAAIEHVAGLWEIGHCILAHHGRKEWGSPVEPQMVEAQILHYADMLSMKFGAGR